LVYYWSYGNYVHEQLLVDSEWPAGFWRDIRGVEIPTLHSMYQLRHYALYIKGCSRPSELQTSFINNEEGSAHKLNLNLHCLCTRTPYTLVPAGEGKDTHVSNICPTAKRVPSILYLIQMDLWRHLGTELSPRINMVPRLLKVSLRCEVVTCELLCCHILCCALLVLYAGI
jgi:hypothetical protein